MHLLTQGNIFLRVIISRVNIFNVLALKGTSKILRNLLKGDLTYSELSNAVGHSATTSRALKALLKLGVIERRVLNERYRPVLYSLTENGKKLAEIVNMLIDIEKNLKSK